MTLFTPGQTRCISLAVAVTVLASTASTFMSMRASSDVGKRQAEIEAIQSGAAVTRVVAADQRCTTARRLADGWRELVAFLDESGVPRTGGIAIRERARGFQRDALQCEALRDRYLRALTREQAEAYDHRRRTGN